MRPIDADALFDALYDNEFQTFCPLDEVAGVIDAAPTLDCEPVRHGEWVHAEPNGFEGQKPFVCSECGLRHPRFGNTNQVYFRFCPWCGIEMKDGVEEETSDASDS